jgi:glycosyltransferase involved in cell wall biosynthesis
MLADTSVTAISTHTRFFPMSLIGVRLAKKLGVPGIHTEHGSAAVKGVSPVVALASNLVDRTMGRLVLRGATRVLCISEGAREFVRDLAGVNGEVFHNAIDTAAFSGAGADSPERRTRLVYVGRIVPGKGWDLALATAEQFASDHPEMELHIVAWDDARPRTRRLPPGRPRGHPWPAAARPDRRAAPRQCLPQPHYALRRVPDHAA